MYTPEPVRGWPGITASDEAVEAVVRDLFSGCHSPTSAVALTAEATDLADHRRQVGWSVDGEQRRPNDLAGVLFSALSVLNRAALDHDSRRLHLHGGMVGHGSSNLVIAGAAGAGKTTLVGALLAHGWSYGTDEMVALDLDGNAEPLRKPLSLKAGSLTRFEFLRRLRHPALAAWPPDRAQPGVPPRWLPDDALRASAVVIPERSDDERGAPRLVRVTGPRAIRLLAENTFDFDRRGAEPALQTLAALVSQVPVHRLIYRDADVAADLLKGPLREVCAPVTVTFVPATSRGRSGPMVQRTPGSVGVAVGDGAVVWCSGPSRLVELSGPGFAVWASADGTSSPEERAAAMGADLDAVLSIDRSLVEQGLLIQLS